MTKERKIFIGRVVRDLYFYPYRSKGENIIRLSVWMASWIVGIVVQQNVESQALGGAYLIYSISLLLEFIPEGRRYPMAKVFHGFFCILLMFLFLGSLGMIFGGPDVKAIGGFCQWLSDKTSDIGWFIFFMMFAGGVLVLIEVHTFFYDEEKEKQCEFEAKQEIVREYFLNQLKGTSKGEKI